MMTRTTVTILAVAATLAASATGSAIAEPAADDAPRGQAHGINRRLPRPEAPLVIAHRGASGYRPEHTLEAYELAIDLGADVIEPDLVMTRDGHLIARHDNVLDLTTDVADREEFADRRTTKTVDGIELTGWFSEDFTLAEIRTLRAVERIPDVRPANAAYDGRFAIPTFDEILELVRRKERETGRRIGLYPETKHPTHFAQQGLDMNRALVRTLRRNGYRDADDPVFIQSFEVANLRELDTMTDLPLVQLLWLEGQPYDVEASGGELTYDDMATPEGLADIATYADGVGPERYHFVIPRDEHGEIHAANATGFVDDAHAAGLLVHPYTFRAENVFLPENFQGGGGPTGHGDLEGEIAAFLEVGIDGFFTDQPDLGVAAKQAFTSR